MRALQRRSGSPQQSYIELTPAGHCVNHEAPEASNAVLARWLRGEREVLAGEREALGGGVEARRVSDVEPQSLWERVLVRALT